MSFTIVNHFRNIAVTSLAVTLRHLLNQTLSLELIFTCFIIVYFYKSQYLTDRSKVCTLKATSAIHLACREAGLCMSKAVLDE